MPPDGHQSDRRVLLLPPTARDGEASRALLASAGIDCFLCPDLQHLCGETTAGAAALIIPEETVSADTSDRLGHLIRQQPFWSDLPVIVLSRSGVESPAVGKALAQLGNVTVIERPVRISTLVSAVRVALRARERQYQARDYFAEQRRAEQMVREARDAAEAANRSKDQFLAVLSHELRTPLSPVVLTVSAMQNDPALPDHLREDLAMVRRNIELETKLIDDLLDVSRVTSGKLRLRMEPVSVHDLLRYVLEVCAADLTFKHLTVRMDLAAAHDMVIGDPARLQQVFWNLLKNAIKFSPEGCHIAVRTSNPAAGQVLVEVADVGMGIPPELMPRLFNAFEQGDPGITRQFGGLGLGLAISKAVIDLHGGTIVAHSDGRDRGSKFTISLAAAPAAAPRSSSRSRPSESNGHPARRVLLVEDHADTSRALARLLTGQGYLVKTAGTVAAALRLADAEPFDILVSDIGLPDATGYQLMEQVRHRLKGIALSGYGMESDLQRSRDAGFSDHIVKPIDVVQLVGVIRRVTAGSAE
jgi:signal transduction histidine kinase